MRQSSLFLTLAMIVFAQCASADAVAHLNDSFACAEEDKACKAAAERLFELHRESHLVGLVTAIEQAKMNAANHRKTAAEHAATEAAAMVQLEKEKEALRLEMRKKNLSGLEFTAALLRSSDSPALSCNALPFMRYECAHQRTDCTGADCPDKFTCKVDLADKFMCFLHPNAKEPLELLVRYSCNGVAQTSQSVPPNAGSIYFACEVN